MTLVSGSRLGPYEIVAPIGGRKTYAYRYTRVLSDLYLVRGLK